MSSNFNWFSAAIYCRNFSLNTKYFCHKWPAVVSWDRSSDPGSNELWPHPVFIANSNGWHEHNWKPHGGGLSGHFHYQQNKRKKDTQSRHRTWNPLCWHLTLRKAKSVEGKILEYFPRITLTISNTLTINFNKSRFYTFQRPLTPWRRGISGGWMVRR